MMEIKYVYYIFFKLHALQSSRAIVSSANRSSRSRFETKDRSEHVFLFEITEKEFSSASAMTENNELQGK